MRRALARLAHVATSHVLRAVFALALILVTGVGCGEPSPPCTPDLTLVTPTNSAPAFAEPSASSESQFISTTQATAEKQAIGAASDTIASESPAKHLLASLSLRQKAAQVLLVSFPGTSANPYLAQLLSGGPPGGLLLLESNITGPEQLKELIAYAQSLAKQAGGIGLLVALDQEGGPVMRIREGVPSMPAARIVGQKYSALEAALLARQTAEALCALGVNVNLAPVADVISEPGSFLYLRSYGGDPTVVARYVRAVTEGYREGGVMTVVKHFPGHGCASEDTHKTEAVSTASQSEFANIHFPPFLAAMEAGTEGIMMAHVIAEAYDSERPASLSPNVVTHVLREGLGFAGLVVSDDLEMAGAAWGQRVAENSASKDSARPPHSGQTAVAALLAGCDLLISTGTLDHHLEIIDTIVEAVESGDLPQNRLDEAVLRILELKSAYGLLPR